MKTQNLFIFVRVHGVAGVPDPGEGGGRDKAGEGAGGGRQVLHRVQQRQHRPEADPALGPVKSPVSHFITTS